MKIKTDFHCHTFYSDGIFSLENLIHKAKINNFAIVTKADHNTTKGNAALRKLAEKNNLIFIPCVEISTKQGHLVGINIDNWDRKLGGKSMQEQIDLVLDLGGIPVIAHPYWRGGLGQKIFKLKNARGYELMNHASPFGSARLIKEMRQDPKLFKKFGQYSGSDSHSGIAYGSFFTEIDVDDITTDSILESLHKMKVTPNWPGLGATLKLWWDDGVPNQLYQIHKQVTKKPNTKK